MINTLVELECFFYGLPAQYALVDSLKYRIMLVSDEFYSLCFLKKLFESKKNLSVVKLPDNTIDNSVAMRWGFEKKAGVDLFPNKGELIITPWEKIVNPALEETDLVDSVYGEIVLIDSFPVSNADIDLAEQLFVAAEIALRVEKHPIPMSISELDELWQAFSVSLDSDTLTANLLDLGRAWYAHNNLHGSIIFNAVPEKYRYE